MELSGQVHNPAALLPRRVFPVPFEQKAGWKPESISTLSRREEFLANVWNRTVESESKVHIFWTARHLKRPIVTNWKGAENLTPKKIRSPDLPACRELLYRLRYPDTIYLRYISIVLVSLNPGVHKSWMPGQDNIAFYSGIMSKVTQLSSSLSTAVCVPEVRKPQREAHISTPSSAKIQMASSVTSVSSGRCVPRTTIYVTVEKLRYCWSFRELLLF